ncbi:MFS transporter [Chroococcidiopsis sp. CCNUC1]|uniref:MFS transporter n=1 Tax=Chroococcidiopsis sp. CCNUC1 TaxID=2653189 RepID=UPI00202060B0|nr:MFS transporter [Chroococcidiopsis sp. CCNUC1]URD52898.1 MFS transporter [Chroococcidiopsis sp. CCNUC1]
MWEIAEIAGHGFNNYWLAQIITEEILTPEEAAAVFSGPQFLVALFAGVVMAFAFQLLLTNFTVALGISALGGGDADDTDNLGSTVRKISTAVGLLALTTGGVALFVASFLAVKLSLVSSAVLGAIIGVVIWSTYFSILLWLGSTTVGSLIGSLVSTATSGFQGLVGTATAALGANVAKNQAVDTAEAIAAAVRQEFTTGLDPDAIGKTLQKSLGNLQLPQLNLDEIRGQFENILKNSDLKSVADSDVLRNINRETFADLVSDRTDLSKQDVNRIVDQLQGVWQQTIGTGEVDPQAQLSQFIKEASPEQLNSSELSEQLEQLVQSTQSNEKQSNGWGNRAVQLGVSALTTAVLERTNLAGIDVENISGQLQKFIDKLPEVDRDKISGQLQQFKQQVQQQAQKLPAQPNSAIRSDVDDYLLKSYPWHLNRETIKQEFRDVIYDAQADPGKVKQELEQLDKDYFTQKLNQRGDLLENKVQEVAQQLEEIRTEILATVSAGASQAQSQDLRSRVENYLRSTGKEELNPEGIERDFQTLLEDPEAGVETLSDRLSQFDRDTLTQLLKQRQDISEEEANNIVGQLESTRDRVVNKAKELQEQAQAKAAEVRQKVEEYLRNTNKEELNPEGIERDFRTLLEDPQVGISVLRSRLSQFDRETLVALLSQRQDLSEEQINQTLDRLESVRDNILQAPQQLTGKAKEQYDKTTTAISEYLRNTNLEELNPEGIQQDLRKVLEDPQEGAIALRDRLSHVDRETLVKLLSQRQDLSEEQVNRAIDSVEEAINSIVQAPRRLASRVQQQAIDFETTLEGYLRNTNKEELNPDSIKRDLQLLLNDPRAGLGSLGDRLSHFDRSTIVALLSQREDISEEEANQIVDRILTVRNSVAEQIEKIQRSVQSVIDSVFDRIRSYLNSLERPELNYEGIQQDFTTLFDDPQAGFDALRNRLSQFDRDTLIAVLSSREDISPADAERIVGQIEGTRDRVLHQAERIQQETQKRLEALKQQAQATAVETKKAASGAAWWLFGTALTSLVASAIAGALAVNGIGGLF